MPLGNRSHWQERRSHSHEIPVCLASHELAYVRRNRKRERYRNHKQELLFRRGTLAHMFVQQPELVYRNKLMPLDSRIRLFRATYLTGQSHLIRCRTVVHYK